MIYFLLIAPGALTAYFLFLRPRLRALPTFQKFYREADGFWQTAWALCGKSVTMAFSYFVQALGWCLQFMDPIASFFGDPDLRAQLTETLQANPVILGYVLMFISACTIAARVRSLMPRDDEQ